MEKQFQIKDVILNIARLKRQRDNIQRELTLLDGQIEQQTKFIENSVMDDFLASKEQPKDKS